MKLLPNFLRSRVSGFTSIPVKCLQSIKAIKLSWPVSSSKLAPQLPFWISSGSDVRWKLQGISSQQPSSFIFKWGCCFFTLVTKHDSTNSTYSRTQWMWWTDRTMLTPSQLTWSGCCCSKSKWRGLLKYRGTAAFTCCWKDGVHFMSIIARKRHNRRYCQYSQVVKMWCSRGQRSQPFQQVLNQTRMTHIIQQLVNKTNNLPLVIVFRITNSCQ